MAAGTSLLWPLDAPPTLPAAREPPRGAPRRYVGLLLSSGEVLDGAKRLTARSNPLSLTIFSRLQLRSHRRAHGLHFAQVASNSTLRTCLKASYLGSCKAPRDRSAACSPHPTGRRCLHQCHSRHLMLLLPDAILVVFESRPGRIMISVLRMHGSAPETHGQWHLVRVGLRSAGPLGPITSLTLSRAYI